MKPPTAPSRPTASAGARILAAIVDASASRCPDHEAVRCMGEALTYEQLAARSSQLAHALLHLGVERGDRVGIFLHKSLESSISIHGVLKAGGAYVPLDPAMPRDRLAFILRDCDIRHVVADPRQRGVLTELAEHHADMNLSVIGLPSDDLFRFPVYDWASLNSLSTESPPVDMNDDDMAYVMYTSGTTGDPKGIIHTHGSGSSYARHAVDTYGVRPDDRLADFPPLHFDQSTFSHFAGPLAGAAAVVVPEVYTKMPASLSQLMEDERITIWYSVPFALVQLALHGVLEERDLTSLRWVKFGGEAFPPKHLRALQGLWPQARFSNVYGPAEVNQCTFFHVPQGIPIDDEPLPIGRVWSAAEGVVLDDDDDELVDDELPGELVVRSPTMMRGYWNRPDLNATAFYERRGADGRRERFYRTGDVVRRRADGVYEFLGRRDRQIKTRGYRVELDEIEAALLTFEGIAENAAYAVPDDSGSLRIEAAVIAEPGQDIDLVALRRHLAARLPGYAVPGRIASVASFPRTSNGKIDRRALGARAAEAAAPDRRPVA